MLGSPDTGEGFSLDTRLAATAAPATAGGQTNLHPFQMVAEGGRLMSFIGTSL
jgi:hypothetical protein